MEEKKKNNLVWLLIILIIVITTSIGLVYNHANKNKNVVVQNEKLSTNSLIENELAAKKEKIKDYIKSIYPLPTINDSYETVVFPTFNSIDEANKDWILAVAYNNIVKNREDLYVYITELETMSNKLFGKVNFNIEEYLKQENGFANYNNKYVWLGQEGSVGVFAEYLIKSIKDISNDTFEVEIVECIEEGIWEEDEGEIGKKLLDINGNKLKEIMYDETPESNDYMKNYLEENSDNLPTKILTLKYNQNDGKCFIVSSKFENNIKNNYQDLEEYIDKIYLMYQEIPVFKTIEEAHLEWLYSIVYYPNPEEMTIEQINDAVKEMFGNNVKELNEKELNKIWFYLNEDEKLVYRNAIWDSDELNYEYRIKNTKKNNDIYEVEIVELIYAMEYNNKTDNLEYYLKDLKGNILFCINENEGDIGEKEINEVFDKNIDKMESKILKIKYNKDNNQYHIISCEKAK